MTGAALILGKISLPEIFLLKSRKRLSRSSGELSYRIHQYETGPSRGLFKQYNYGPPDMSVACAIVAGLLKRDEMPAELLEAIRGPLGFYQSLKERNELKEPE